MGTAWSFATCSVADDPLLDSIAAEAIRKMSEFDEQACANTAFAFAALSLWHHEPLLNSIAAKAIAIMSEGENLDVGNEPAAAPAETDPAGQMEAPGGVACHQLLDTLGQLVHLNSRSRMIAASSMSWARLD